MVSQLPELGEQPYSAADAEWDAFVAAHPHCSLLQTTNCARLQRHSGWSSQRVWRRPVRLHTVDADGRDVELAAAAG